MTATSRKPRARAAQVQTRPEIQTDPTEDIGPADRVVQMARRAVELNRLIEISDEACRKASGRETVQGKTYAELSKLRCGELVAIEDYISYAQCTSVEGALAQLILAASWANQCQGDDESCGDFERIERLTNSALYRLAAELKIDLSQLGGDSYLSKRDKDITSEREVHHG